MVTNEQVEAAITAYDKARLAELRRKHGYAADVPVSDAARDWYRPFMRAALEAAETVRLEQGERVQRQSMAIYAILTTLVVVYAVGSYFVLGRY